MPGCVPTEFSVEKIKLKMDNHHRSRSNFVRNGEGSSSVRLRRRKDVTSAAVAAQAAAAATQQQQRLKKETSCPEKIGPDRS